MGTNKTVTVTGINISGADAGNYTLGNTSATATASITPYILTVTAAADSKQWDKTTAATVHLTLSAPLGADQVAVAYASATFNSATVANNKTVTISGLALYRCECRQLHSEQHNDHDHGQHHQEVGHRDR